MATLKTSKRIKRPHKDSKNGHNKNVKEDKTSTQRQ